MNERQIRQTEKVNAVLNSVNYQAQEAVLDPNLPDADKCMSSEHLGQRGELAKV